MTGILIRRGPLDTDMHRWETCEETHGEDSSYKPKGSSLEQILPSKPSARTSLAMIIGGYHWHGRKKSRKEKKRTG